MLRLRDDGTIPPDNPFVNRPGAKPGNLHHRPSQHPRFGRQSRHPGEIWSCEWAQRRGRSEHPRCPRKNYGWPVVSNGRFYSGPRVSLDPYKEGMEPPRHLLGAGHSHLRTALLFRRPLPQLEKTIYSLAACAGRRSPAFRSPGARRFQRPVGRTPPRRDFTRPPQPHPRRASRQGPDGLLYLLTDEADGALLRIDPAK